MTLAEHARLQFLDFIVSGVLVVWAITITVLYVRAMRYKIRCIEELQRRMQVLVENTESIAERLAISLVTGANTPKEVPI